MGLTHEEMSEAWAWTMRNNVFIVRLEVGFIVNDNVVRVERLDRLNPVCNWAAEMDDRYS